MKRLLTILGAAMLVVGTNPAVNAATDTIVFLDDYELTQDIEDIVHLGDQTINDFYRPVYQDNTWTFNFEVSSVPQNGEIRLYVDHYQANQDLGYVDRILINDTEIGSLSDSDETHWITDEFIANADLLNAGQNSLVINSYNNGSNWDDFEFTNLYLEIEDGSGGCTGTVEASTYHTSPVYGSSDLTNHIGYFLLPIGAVIGIRFWRRKR